jgi:ATP-binding cassette subfamily B protein
LVLDEATSSIDTETEIMIREATARLTQNRTSIVIAHRLATIQRADKIIVLEHGKIAEEGTHSELLRKGGLYKKLYEAQFASLETV